MSRVTRRQQRHSALLHMGDEVTAGDHPSGLRTQRRV